MRQPWSKAPYTLRHRLANLSESTSGKLLLLVFLVVAATSLTGGVVHFIFGQFASYGEAMWWALAHMIDPGQLGDDEGLVRRIFGLFLVLLGLVLLVGVLIEVLTNVVDSSLKRLTEDPLPSGMRNHLLIIGWSEMVPFMLERLSAFMASQLDKAFDAIVILVPEGLRAERQSLREQLAGKGALEPYLVFASPRTTAALDRVAARSARAILTITPAGVGRIAIADVKSIRTGVSLARYLGAEGGKGQYVGIILLWGEHAAAAALVLPPNFDLIVADKGTAALLTLGLRDDGWGQAILELTQSAESNNHIYLIPGDDLAGTPYEQLLAHFETALPIGILRGSSDDRTVMLAPPAVESLAPGDRIIVIDTTRGQATRLRAESAPLPASPELSAFSIASPGAPRKILIVGLNHQVLTLLEELCGYPAGTFEVVLLSSAAVEPEARPAWLWSAVEDKLKLTYIQASPTDQNDLRLALEQHDPDAVLVTGDWKSGEESFDAVDASALLSLMYLRELVRPKRIPLYAALYLPKSAEVFSHDPVVRSMLIGGGLLIPLLSAQILVERELELVYEALFSGEQTRLESLAFEPEDGKAAPFGAVYGAVLKGGAVTVGTVIGGVVQVRPPLTTMIEPGTLLLVIVPKPAIDDQRAAQASP